MPLKTRKASIFKDQKTSNFKKSLVLMKYGGKKVLKIVLIQKKKTINSVEDTNQGTETSVS